MSRRKTLPGFVAGAVVLAAIVVAAIAASGGSAKRAWHHEPHGPKLNHVFVIVLENHSQGSVIGDPAAPYITSLAHTYGMASNYYGVTHPSEPNYVAAISGSNWFVNDDNPNNRFDHTNLVDQLEQHHKTWAAYMESMPSAGYLGNNYPDAAALPPSGAQLYVSKHNPFVLFNDIRTDPTRLANVKPYSDFASDLAGNHVADFVWISPNQCHDMHGGVNVHVAADGSDGTPCPFNNTAGDANDQSLKAKADAFTQSAVQTIMSSKAWSEGHSAIFVISDENDFVSANGPINDGWESAAGCCDSPLLPNGYQFLNSSGIPDGHVWSCPFGANPACTYGGGLVPAIIVTNKGPRGLTSNAPYNHYSLLRTIEQNWRLGYLENAADETQVHSMSEFLAH
jgi:phosphatidylinositol-3-phosphatase